MGNTSQLCWFNSLWANMGKFIPIRNDTEKWIATEKTTNIKKTSIPFPFRLNGIWSWWQFSFRFSEPNRIPFGSKSKGKLSPQSYPIQFERKWKYSFLSQVPLWNLFSDHEKISASWDACYGTTEIPHTLRQYGTLGFQGASTWSQYYREALSFWKPARNKSSLDEVLKISICSQKDWRLFT